MNKLQLSLLLVGLFAAAALARTSPQIRRPFKFSPGHTYIYEYRGTQWNGLAKLADQYAGLTLDCDVILQATTQDKEVLMKLSDIKVEQLHTQTLNNQDIRKLNPGKEQNERQITMYKEELSKPIRFTYLDGKVVRFFAESSDQEWSINIKKSILSMLQLDLAPTKIIKSVEKELAEEFYGYQGEQFVRDTNEMPLVYPVYEEHFGGICETLYQIDSIDTNDDDDDDVDVEPATRGLKLSELDFSDVLNVTKTVNYKNCLTDPSVSYDRHSFDVNPQTKQGRLVSKFPTVASLNYYPVPEELKQKYSSFYTSFQDKDNVASPVPVERYSWTKYNITTGPQSLAQRRMVPVASQQNDLALIEGVYSESKIKYQAGDDVLISETQQSLKLVTCSPTSQLVHVVPEMGELINKRPQEPTVQYKTIQCELSAQKLKFYQAYAKLAQVQQELSMKSQPVGSSSSLYSYKMILPFALSASWYPLVANGQESADLQLSSSVAGRLLNPELLAQSYENLLFSLADDVISEDVAQSKRAGEKIVRLINIVAFMPRSKLIQCHDRIINQIQSNKQQQQHKSIDGQEVSKWKVVRKLFLDSLPLAGSKQAIEVIEILIERQHVRTWEAQELCESVPANLRYPDTEIIDGFIRIAQLPQIRKSRSTFASCSIAVGKMIGNAYAKSQDASYKPTTTSEDSKLPLELEKGEELLRKVVEAADPRNHWQSFVVAGGQDNNNNNNNNMQQQQELYERLVLDDQDLIKYVKLYKQLLQKSQHFHEKVIYLETLAHMRVPHVLPILEPFFTGRLSLSQCLGQQPLDIGRPIEQAQWYNYHHHRQHQHQSEKSQQTKDWMADQYDDQSFEVAAEECNYLRTIAIYAGAHLARTTPNKLQAILLPVFENTMEPYQLRIAAFTTLMLAPIEEHLLERLASQMWREPNKEVASFVVGAIDTMTKMTTPSLLAYKRAAQKAAESMPKQYLDTWRFSWIAAGDHFDQQKQAGLRWLAEMVKSNVSTIPRAAYFNLGRFHGHSASKYDNHFELGFTSKGLESLLLEYIQYTKQQQQQQSPADFNILSTIFDNLFTAKDELVQRYRDSRNSIKQSILADSKLSLTSAAATATAAATDDEEDLAKNFFFKRHQPMEGVNNKEGKRQKRSTTTVDARKQQTNDRLENLELDAEEEAKVTIFSKLFDSTSYQALDKKQIIELLEKSDDYIKMVADELIMGGKLHYVKMMSPNNMWHMVPSQMGLPIVVTHRQPIIFSLKIDGSQNGQLTSNKLAQMLRQQATTTTTTTKGQNRFDLQGLNVTALIHPKIIHSNFKFMFAVEQANCEAYGVQVEKSHQLSLPMELSVAYSPRPHQTLSVQVQPKTPARIMWVKEAAKTFIGQVTLASAQSDNWLGQEHLVRVNEPKWWMLDENNNNNNKHQQEIESDALTGSIIAGVQSLLNKPKVEHQDEVEKLETPFKFEHRFVQKPLNLELYLDGVTDDLQIMEVLTKPELSDRLRPNLSADTVAERREESWEQHSKSGPFSHYLHLIDSAINRPSKYLEFYQTLKPIASNNQSPIYRFNLILKDNNKQEQAKKSKLFNTNTNQLFSATSRPIIGRPVNVIDDIVAATDKRNNMIQFQVPITVY